MRFRKSMIVIIFAISMMLSGCSWVTGGDSLFVVQDYEAKRLVDVFGDDVLEHIDSGRLTDDEYDVLMAYRAGTGYLLEKYRNIKIESFQLMSDDTYEIVFTYDDTSFLCSVCPTVDGYECSDNLESSQ